MRIVSIPKSSPCSTIARPIPPWPAPTTRSATAMRRQGLRGSSPMHAELKVAVLGLGYIGLPTAAVIARTGAEVLGVDVTPSVVNTVNSGKVHIEEVDLDGHISDVVARGNLRASKQNEPTNKNNNAKPT